MVFELLTARGKIFAKWDYWHLSVVTATLWAHGLSQFPCDWYDLEECYWFVTDVHCLLENKMYWYKDIAPIHFESWQCVERLNLTMALTCVPCMIHTSLHIYMRSSKIIEANARNQKIDSFWPSNGIWRQSTLARVTALCLTVPGGRLNKKDGLTRYGDSHVKDKTS